MPSLQSYQGKLGKAKSRQQVSAGFNTPILYAYHGSENMLNTMMFVTFSLTKTTKIHQTNRQRNRDRQTERQTDGDNDKSQIQGKPEKERER